MYVDHGDDSSSTDTAHDELTVEMDGESYQVEENYDFDQDGHNDAAVIETDDGYVAFSDTDGDGTADVAVELDHDGNVIAGAEYDESSHQWTEEDPNSLPTPHDDGADEHGGSHPSGHSTDTQTSDTHTHTTTPHSSDTGGSSGHTGSGSGEDITVQTSDGSFDAGHAEYDSDGDGTDDTAVVTDQDGTTYAFTDSDGDGTADEAVVIESDGHVTVAENTGDDNWEVVEEGHVGSDGTYHSDSGSSGSDSVWAESK